MHWLMSICGMKDNFAWLKPLSPEEAVAPPRLERVCRVSACPVAMHGEPSLGSGSQNENRLNAIA